jgi:hypothetical protein
MPVQKPKQTPFFLAKGLVGFLDFARKEYWGYLRRAIVWRKFYVVRVKSFF